MSEQLHFIRFLLTPSLSLLAFLFLPDLDGSVELKLKMSVHMEL